MTNLEDDSALAASPDVGDCAIARRDDCHRQREHIEESRMNGYNFTERVRKSLQLAREEAMALTHQYVGTEHILLGLCARAVVSPKRR